MAKKYLQLSQILKRLLFERNLRPSDLARDLNMPPPTIHRIVTGESTRPYKSSLSPIAEYFNVKVEQLIGEEPLFPSMDGNSISLSQRTRRVALVAWELLGYEPKSAQGLSEIIVSDVSDKAFAVINPDYSMEPLFQKNSILIFDPEVKPIDRSYVLVKLHDPDTYVFKQLLIDLNQKFIKSLNQDLSIASLRKLEDNDKIIARLVENRQKV
jgi:transcriptional regulator with XRE-family HTH domain